MLAKKYRMKTMVNEMGANRFMVFTGFCGGVSTVQKLQRSSTYLDFVEEVEGVLGPLSVMATFQNQPQLTSKPAYAKLTLTRAVARPFPFEVVPSKAFLKLALGSSTRVFPPRTTKPVTAMLMEGQKTGSQENQNLLTKPG